jgi:NAD+ synthase (glutamine-hydrolysing)
LVENFRKHVKYVRVLNSELIVFPECSLVGYSLGALKKYKKDYEYNKLKYIHKSLFNEVLKTDKTVVFGSILRENYLLYNCAFVVNKEGIKVYKKINLTEEEKDLFAKGKEILTFNIKGKKIGVIICRDQSYTDIFSAYKSKNINLMIILSAHYYKPSEVFWKKIKNLSIPIVRAMDFGITVAKVNTVGMLDKRVSHGNTLVVTKEGRILKILDEYNEGVVSVSL